MNWTLDGYNTTHRSRVAKLNELSGINGKAVGVPDDVSSEREIDHLCEQVQEIEGKLDILVANAGVT
jgi:NAD(P)-dependent dehydrogenase (short-subunit alcohol dehydrogenase family)